MKPQRYLPRRKHPRISEFRTRPSGSHRLVARNMRLLSIKIPLKVEGRKSTGAEHFPRQDWHFPTPQGNVARKCSIANSGSRLRSFATLTHINILLVGFHVCGTSNFRESIQLRGGAAFTLVSGRETQPIVRRMASFGD